VVDSVGFTVTLVTPLFSFHY